MTIRTRKFFGTIALLVLVVVWSLLGMTIAQTPWLANSGLLQAIFYVVAGLGSGLPAIPIISWMPRPARAAEGENRLNEPSALAPRLFLLTLPRFHEADSSSGC